MQTITLEDSYKKIKEFRTILGKNLLQKEEIIDIMCISFIAREPLLMIGPPGTAKSRLIDDFCGMLGLNDNYERLQAFKSDLKNGNGRPKAEAFEKLCAGDFRVLENLYNIRLPAAKTVRERLRNWGRKKVETDKKLAELLTLLDEPDAGCQRKYFSYLLTEFTDPSEVLGPIDIPKILGQLVNINAKTPDEFEVLQKKLLKKIEQGHIETSKFERITRNMLPLAEVVFLDEVFKANSAILNALLTIMNERKYYQPDGPVESPLKILFAASNELPGDTALRAFVDRFPLRIYNHSIVQAEPAATDKLSRLLTMGADAEKKKEEERLRKEVKGAAKGKKNGNYYKHFLHFQTYLIDQVPWISKTNPVREAFLKWVTGIDSDFNLNLSDRRLIKLFKMVCASALLKRFEEDRAPRVQGSPALPLAMEDLKVLKYTSDLMDPDRIFALGGEVEQIVNDELSKPRGRQIK